MSAVATILRYGIRESMRRRVFLVVFVLTVAFLALYAVGAAFAFKDVGNFADSAPEILDAPAFTGATILGLAMFATFFLGTVLAVFLTLGVVRGDAERGLLQPLVVRPIGRSVLLWSRFAGAAAVSGGYVLVVYGLAVAITAIAGSWWPDHVVTPGIGLAAGVVIVAALSLLASIFLSATAQGIAVLMLFGGGLTAGLLGEIGKALDSATLREIARVASWALPFEALYEGGLRALISNTEGLTGAILSLGPFGGAQGAGPLLALWAVIYLAAVLGIGAAAFARRDL
ncbi:MAG: type transport system permease protein [Solirubrobacterales bacterium]|nr:type transport system permease protein [Solirubrobacterales bacterium]